MKRKRASILRKRNLNFFADLRETFVFALSREAYPGHSESPMDAFENSRSSTRRPLSNNERHANRRRVRTAVLSRQRSRSHGGGRHRKPQPATSSLQRFALVKCRNNLYPKNPNTPPATAPAPITAPADSAVTAPVCAASSNTPAVAAPAPPTPAPTDVTAASLIFSFPTSFIALLF